MTPAPDEQGLLEEKQRVTLRVSETKGNRLRDFSAASDPGEPASAEKVPLVKRISQKYSAAAAQSAQRAASVWETAAEVAEEGASSVAPFAEADATGASSVAATLEEEPI